jgi:threonine dehydrogenase-like Zn-dependent dehydrogenase
VIDCGCGPIGGLAILAEMVGPAGRVVGVDFSEPTIQVMERAGVPRGTVERLPRSAREAGLEIAEADGFFATQDPAIGFEIHVGSLAAARERAIEAGIAAEVIDDMVASSGPRKRADTSG